MGSGDLSDCFSLTFGPDANLYARSSGRNAVLRYDGASGKFDRAFVRKGSGGLEFPWGLAFGPDKNLYVSNIGKDRVLRYDGASGDFIDEFVSNAGHELVDPRGLGFGPDGKLYVCSFGNGSVLRYDGITGAFLDAVVPSHYGCLSTPIDLAFAEMAIPNIVPESPNLIEILFGVIEGGGGAIRFPRGPILRIGPPQPPVLDVLRAHAIHEIAASMSHDAGREIRRAAMQALRTIGEAEIERLETGRH
jgi:hypothetical protein